MFKLLFFLSFFTLISCSSKEKKPEATSGRSRNWDEIVTQLKIKLKEEDYPSPAGPLFTQETFQNKKMRWCFIGDSGYVNQAQAQVSKLLLKKGNCDRIYHLGDIVYPIGIASADDPQVEEKFLAFQAPFERPYSLVMGNHEYFGLNANPWLEVARRHKNLHFPHFFYAHKINGICLVALDSTPIDFGRPEDPKVIAQAEWIEGMINNELKSCTYRILIAHHPYTSPSKKRQPKEALLNFYSKYIIGNFDLLIAGHEHVLAYVGKTAETEQFISGAGGNFTKSTDLNQDLEKYPGHRGPGALYLDINSAGPIKVKATIMALTGEEFRTVKKVLEKKLRP